MCGIVAYSGYRQCYSILLKCLKKLEYRGYDSAGISLLGNPLQVYKKAGNVNELDNFIKFKQVGGAIGTVGIGHTRWATHGIPSDINAHPHIAALGKIAIVHNGIIENSNTLRQELIHQGYTFKSETDTEVLVNFIELIKKNHTCNLEEAVRLALAKVVGAYAIVVIDIDAPNTLIATKRGSPLVMGIGKGELFLASDVTPLLAYTNEVIFIKDNEVIRIKDSSFVIKNFNNVPLTPYIKRLDIALEKIEKGNFEHFMLKEIYEQPISIRNALRGRLNISQKSLLLGGVNQYLDALVQASKITIVACGTSWHAALVAEYFLEEFCRIPVEVEYASEFRYRAPIIGKGDVVIAISQSGETADTLAAIALTKSLEATIVSICNVVESSIARAAHTGLYTHAGVEIGVASTKCFTSQLSVLLLLTLQIAEKKGTISADLFQALILELDTIPAKIIETLSTNSIIQQIATSFKEATNFLYLGRGYHFPIALEGALKLKELSYIHAEGYPAAEMKHGPLALIDEDMPVVFIAIKDRSYDKIISNMEEVKARKGKIIAIVTQNDDRIHTIADYTIAVPAVHEILMPLLTVIPLQLLAYHIAVLRGCNIDQPRNLAKCVTVE